MDRSTGDAFAHFVVLLFEDVPSHEAAGFSHIDLIRCVAVVGELIGSQPITFKLLAILFGRSGIVLHPPQSHQHRIEIAP